MDNGPCAAHDRPEFAKVPADTKPFSKEGGGYWFGQRTLNTNPKPFIAESEYKAATLKAPETADAQLSRTRGLNCMLAGYEAARQAVDASLPVSQRLTRSAGELTRRPPATVTPRGEVVGYQTTNGAREIAIREKAERTAAAAATATASLPPAQPRYSTMPRAMAPGMFGEHATYRRDFGDDGSDPMERAAPGERLQTRMTTARELAEGTTRNTNHPPGYTGHLPQSKYHELARAQADAPDERSNQKDDMLLFALDQFSRTRVPHTTTHKPRAPCNVTYTQPSQGPTNKTVYGAQNLLATRAGVPPVDNTHFINSKTGILSYFDNGVGQYVSENGLANAGAYFKDCRPGDGRFQTGMVNKTTAYGAPFKKTNSLV
eukprot:353504-Chlamydomonas_euryale.AAC.11